MLRGEKCIRVRGKQSSIKESWETRKESSQKGTLNERDSREACGLLHTRMQLGLVDGDASTYEFMASR